jgi:hypothetical protein
MRSSVKSKLTRPGRFVAVDWQDSAWHPRIIRGTHVSEPVRSRRGFDGFPDSFPRDYLRALCAGPGAGVPMTVRMHAGLLPQRGRIQFPTL